jgi:hypothetical protein
MLVMGVLLPDQAPRMWPEHAMRRHQESRPSAEHVGGRWAGWRLLGRNNRELGRSPGTFRSITACLVSIDDLKRRVGSATRLLSVDVEDGRWLWRLEVDGTVVAVSARSYQRQRECVYSLDQFLAGVACADPPVLRIELPAQGSDGADADGADGGDGGDGGDLDGRSRGAPSRPGGAPVAGPSNGPVIPLATRLRATGDVAS